MDISLHTLAAAVFKNQQAFKANRFHLSDTAPEAVAAEEDAERKVVISLIRTPRSGMKGLVQIRQQLGLPLTIGEFLSKAQQLPLLLLEDVSLSQYQQRCADILAAEACIEVTEAITGVSINDELVQQPAAMPLPPAHQEETTP